MHKLFCLFFVVLATDACKSTTKKTPTYDIRIESLRSIYDSKLKEAEQKRDSATGWLSRNDCDGMIWTGKYAASNNVEGVIVEAAQYPGEPGKWARRPAPWCWTQELGDQGSKTEWSRDMFIAGLLPYVWSRKRVDILENHIAYGKAHPAVLDDFPAWQMGEPLADGRVLYTPSLIGLSYKALHGLGGEPNANAIWPSVYPKGLVDFEAHLQVMGIWLQGEIAESLDEADAMPSNSHPDHEKQANLRVSNEMYERLQEHAARQPGCALYQAVYGMYSGDMGPALDILLDQNSCDYLRCVDTQCELAEWIFSASLTLDHFKLF